LIATEVTSRDPRQYELLVLSENVADLLRRTRTA
jgi:hypothetical protein